MLIPSSMVERIEAISGGASARVGSEAIAGVVNIILRKNLDGTAAGCRRRSDPEE